MASIIQMRRDLAAEWTTVNPILAQGEIGMEVDTFKLKIGNGTAAWNSLPYIAGGAPIGERVLYDADGYHDVINPYILEKLLLQPGLNATLRVGSTLGGDEYMNDTFISAVEGNVLVLNLFANVTKRVYISGLPVGSAVVFFKQYAPQS